MRITNIYTALAASPSQMLAGAEGAHFPSFFSHCSKVMQRVPGSWHQAPVLRFLPLQVGFFGGLLLGFFVGFVWVFFPEVLRDFEKGLLRVSQAGSIFPPLRWSFKASLAWSHPVDVVNLM